MQKNKIAQHIRNGHFCFPYRTRYLDRYAKRLANASLLFRGVRDSGTQLIEAHDSILGLHVPPDLEILSSWHLLSLDLDACHHTLIERSQHTCHWKKKKQTNLSLSASKWKKQRKESYNLCHRHLSPPCRMPRCASCQIVPQILFEWLDRFSTARTSHLSQTSMTSVGNALQLIKVWKCLYDC